MTAGSWIGSVSAGQDIGGAISAATFIGGAYVLGGTDWQAAAYFLGVAAGRDVIGTVTAGRSIVEVSAGRNILGAVHAQEGDVWQVRAGVNITGSDSETGTIGGPPSGGNTPPPVPGNVVGTVTASRDVYAVYATQDVLGKVTAQAGFVYAVNGKRSILGGVDAHTDIGRRTVRVADPDWRSHRDDPFAGSAWVTTYALLGVGVITQTEDIGGGVRAATGDIATEVRAGRDLLAGTVTAAGSIGGVTGETNTIGFTDHGLGVHAGRTIAATISAGVDIRTVTARTIAGTVAAGEDIGSVIAYGLEGIAGAPQSLPLPETGIDEALWIFDSEENDFLLKETPDAPPVVPDLTAGGLISASIAAGGSIGSVTAFGDITANITAGDSLGAGTGGVWAFGQIQSNVTAQNGSLTVRSWGDIQGTLSAAEDLQVWARGELTADSNSVLRNIVGGSWLDLSGDSVAKGSIDLRSLGKITSKAISTEGSVTVASAGDITSEEIRAWDLVQVTSGGQITSQSIVSQDGDVIADARTSIWGYEIVADKNLWVSARGGSVDSGLTTDKGWVYVWANTDVRGSVNAKDTVSTTAKRDVSANITSSDDAVDVFAGRTVSGNLKGKWGVEVEASKDITGTVTGADVIVRAGGDVTNTVTADFDADVAAVGSILTNVNAKEGRIDVVADLDIKGTMTAKEQIAVIAGRDVEGTLTAKQGVGVSAGRDINVEATSEQGDVSVWAGGNILGWMSAKKDVIVEATGNINATVIAEVGASVLADGDIAGSIQADWLADVRSSEGEVTATVTTMHTTGDRLTHADSPTKKRLAYLNADIAAREQATGPHEPAWWAQLNDLKAERELHQLGDLATDYRSIPADRIRGLLADSLAKQYEGGYYRGMPTKGYVALADVVGTDGYFMLLEPYRYETSGGPIIGSISPAVSLLNNEDPSGNAEYYRVVKRFSAGTELPPDQLRQGLMSDASVKRNVEGHIDNLVTGVNTALLDTVTLGMRLVPLVGAFDDFIQGNYVEGAISLVGDATMLIGLGAAAKARQCVYAGNQLIKMARVASVGIEGGIALARMGQGFFALGGGHTGEAFGYFGDATLRMFGLSKIAVSWLRKPICFVAGTQIHTEQGLRPIEQIEVGDRVWAFDRQSGQWRLCNVVQTVKRESRVLTTVRLREGDEITGTDGHPVWVIEGERLVSRPTGDHGEDEQAGTTPGRWVALGAVQPGDVVLTRIGRTSHVEAAWSRVESVPVYNMEVEGLHSYAVGTCGLLAHNTDTCVGTGVVAATGREAAKQTSKPAVQVSGTTSSPAKKKATKATVAGTAPPASKTTVPSGIQKTSDGRTRRPRSVGDSRVLHKSVNDGGRQTIQMMDRDLNATVAVREKYTQAKASGVHANKVKAGEELGVAGADVYMQKHIGATPVYRQQVANGNYDFDLIYKKGDTYYVVEAKGPGGKFSPRQVSPAINPNTQSPDYAAAGSRWYLNDTIAHMKRDGNGVSQAMANELQDALAVGKVKYVEVKTVPKNKSAHFSIQWFDISGS